MQRQFIRVLWVFSVIWLYTVNNYAQIPGEVLFDATGSSRGNCTGQFAGTIAIGPVEAESNDIDLDQMFLCYGDRVQIIHSGDQDLSGDPDPTSEPGIGYAWYECAPTETGPTLETIFDDPCLLTNPAPLNGIYIYIDETNGDALFENGINFDGQTIPDFFNLGEPVEIFFSPITFDEEIGGQAQYEGNPPGQCVHTNVDVAFSVVYLNPIQMASADVSTNNGNCQGSFIAKGGLPQFDGSSYAVTIESIDQPGVFGSLIGSDYTHDDRVEFTVPEPGSYRIFVEDGKSCSYSFDMDLNCDGVIFNYPDITVQQGDNVCIGMTVNNFEDMLSFAMAISWDPTVLEYTGFQNFDIPMGTITGINDNNAALGLITMLWDTDNFNTGTSWPEGGLVLEFCFNVIGDPGDVSPISIGSRGTTIFLAANTSGQLPAVANNGTVTVGYPTDLGATISGCGSGSGNDGSFTVTAFGGQGPYEVEWRNSLGTLSGTGSIGVEGGNYTVTDLPPNNYNVTVIDANNDEFDISINIDNSAGPEANFIIDDPTCNNVENGRIEAQVIAVEPHITRWSNGIINNDVIDDLAAGIYQVTIEDGNGCEAVYTHNLEVPILEINAEVMDVSCVGMDNGTITAVAIGGTPIGTDRYNYRWDGLNPFVGDTSQRVNLTEGTYFLTVTDANNCQTSDSFTIGATSRVFLEEIVIDPILCNGDSSRIRITANTTNTAMDHGYAFDWAPNTGDVTLGRNMNQTSDIPAGFYSVTVVDVNIDLECRFDTTLLISQPAPLTLDIISIRDESCTVGGDGEIIVEASGGAINDISDYTYTWSNMQTGPSISDLVGGNYSVTVSDLNGCTDTLSAEIGTPVPAEILGFDSVSISCPGETDGSLTVLFDPGNSNVLSIEWTDQDNNTYSGETITDLSAGEYTVTITTDDGCEAMGMSVLAGAEGIRLDSVQIVQPSCPGEMTGQIRVFVSGGSGNYEYNWSVPGAPNDAVLPAIGAGTYSVSISQSGSNCPPVFVDNILVEDPPPIQAMFSDIIPAGCADQCNGGATVIPSGGPAGTGNYFTEWQTGTVNPTAGNLCPGLNFVIVTDFQCGDTFFVDIPAPDTLRSDFILNEPSCKGDANGSIVAEPFGGTAPYQVEWFAGPTTPAYEDLEAGTYLVRVRDDNNCLFTTQVELGEPDSMVAFIDTVLTRDITCPEAADGSIVVDFIGGNSGSATYQWTGSVSGTETAEPLGPGTYIVTVTDSRGCTDTASYTLVDAEPIRADIFLESEIPCFGETTQFTVDTATGGTGGPYRFSINNGVLAPLGRVFNLPSGTYLIGVFDANGCQYDTTIFLDQPDPIFLDLGPDLEAPLGDSVLVAPNQIVSPTAIDSFIWTASDPILSCNLCPETYASPLTQHAVQLTIVNQDGCIATDEILVNAVSRRNVYIPNAFSPNGDGINDRFTVFAGRGVEGFGYIHIFNRWGDKVFHRENVSAATDGPGTWDGTFNGKEQDPGVYVYLVEVIFLDGSRSVLKGDIQLIR
jgi:gliding motility-associated-like protein